MKICPKCRRACGDQHTVCSKCGAELVDYNEFMSSQNVCPNCDHFYDKTYNTCPTCGIPLISNDEWHKLKDSGYIPKPQSTQQNTPHCPTCGSTNVEKISGASKVGKAVLCGLFAAGSISKTFHCKNCGYRW